MMTRDSVRAFHKDLWHGRANVDHARSKSVEDYVVGRLCRTSLDLFDALLKVGYDFEGWELRCITCGGSVETCKRAVSKESCAL